VGSFCTFRVRCTGLHPVAGRCIRLHAVGSFCAGGGEFTAETQRARRGVWDCRFGGWVRFAEWVVAARLVRVWRALPPVACPPGRQRGVASGECEHGTRADTIQLNSEPFVLNPQFGRPRGRRSGVGVLGGVFRHWCSSHPGPEFWE
jgi:hypothetical protein